MLNVLLLLVGGKRGEGGGGECDQLKIRVREMEDEMRRREAKTREKMAALERKHLAAEVSQDGEGSLQQCVVITVHVF